MHSKGSACIAGVQHAQQRFSMHSKGTACIAGVQHAQQGYSMHSKGSACIAGVKHAQQGFSMHSRGSACIAEVQHAQQRFSMHSKAIIKHKKRRLFTISFIILLFTRLPVPLFFLCGTYCFYRAYIYLRMLCSAIYRYGKQIVRSREFHQPARLIK